MKAFPKMHMMSVIGKVNRFHNLKTLSEIKEEDDEE